MVKVFSILVIFSFLGLSACKKDSNGPANCSANWASDVEAEMTALSNAATAYGTDPTHETCVDYKSAYQDYVNALKPLLNCSVYTAQQKEDLQDAIDSAEDDISTLCDE
jgi:predicted GTPase